MDNITDTTNATSTYSVRPADEAPEPLNELSVTMPENNYYNFLMRTLQGKRPLPAPDHVTENKDGTTTLTWRMTLPLDSQAHTSEAAGLD